MVLLELYAIELRENIKTKTNIFHLQFSIHAIRQDTPLHSLSRFKSSVLLSALNIDFFIFVICRFCSPPSGPAGSSERGTENCLKRTSKRMINNTRHNSKLKWITSVMALKWTQRVGVFHFICFYNTVVQKSILTNQPTNWQTPWKTVFLRNLIVNRLVK